MNRPDILMLELVIELAYCRHVMSCCRAVVDDVGVATMRCQSSLSFEDPMSCAGLTLI